MTMEPPQLPQLFNYCRYSGLLAEFGAGPAPVPHSDNVTTPIHPFTVAFRYSVSKQL
jgi:hypothetical protein